jgi:hypothetical protein
VGKISIIISTMEKKEEKMSKRQAKKLKQKMKQQEAEKKEESEGGEREEEQADFDLNHVQEGGQEEVQVDFLIAELNEEYYHSLKTILLRYSQITHANHSELTDAVLSNKAIGNVTLADDQDEEEEDEEDEEGEEDEDNVYSVLTILPGKHKVAKAIKKTASQAASRSPNKEQIVALTNQ